MVKNTFDNAGDTRDAALIPGWEAPLEKETATYSSILAWENPIDEGAWKAIDHGVTKSRT